MMPGTDDQDQDDMTPADHHIAAAGFHEAAARAHKEAAKSMPAEKQAHHAQIAHGNAVKADHHGKMASVKYSEGKH
jgi:hypothetical protein